MRILRAFFRALWCHVVGHKWVWVSDKLGVRTMRCKRCDVIDRGEVI
jgi:hypothetical protein